MRFYQKRQFEMLMLVASVLKKERLNICKKVPALEKSIELYLQQFDYLFKLHLGIINAVALQTQYKIEVKTLLIDSLLKLIRVIKAYQAEFTNRKDLTDVRYTRRSLEKSTAEDLYLISGRLTEAAKKIKSINRFGIFPGDVADAIAYRKEFNDKKLAPSKKRKAVAAENKEMISGIKNCITLLKERIDPLMEIIGDDDKKLYSRYKNIRTVLPKDQGRPSDKEASYRKSRRRKPVGEKKKEHWL